MKIKDCFMRRNRMIVVIDANEKSRDALCTRQIDTDKLLF